MVVPGRCSKRRAPGRASPRTTGRRRSILDDLTRVRTYVRARVQVHGDRTQPRPAVARRRHEPRLGQPRRRREFLRLGPRALAGAAVERPARPLGAQPGCAAYAQLRALRVRRIGRVLPLIPKLDFWLARTPGGHVVGILVLRGDWIDQLSVDPNLTGRGIGVGLLDLAKRERPHGLRLWTFVSNDGDGPGQQMPSDTFTPYRGSELSAAGQTVVLSRIGPSQAEDLDASHSSSRAVMSCSTGRHRSGAGR